MRKAFIVALCVMSVGASTQLAMARQATCSGMYGICRKAAGDDFGGRNHCFQNQTICMKDGSWGVVMGPGSLRRTFKADTPPPSKQSTATGAPNGSNVRDHRGEPANTPTPGSPPPAAAPGTASTAPAG